MRLVTAVLVIMCVSAAAAVAAFVGPKRLLAASPIVGERFQEPDRYRMRAHRLAQLTDEQVLELHRKSVAEFEKHKQLQADEGKRYWQEREQRARACEGDPVLKLRRGSCFEPLPIGFEELGKPAMGWESADRFFESYVMGICNLAASVHQARRNNCLP